MRIVLGSLLVIVAVLAFGGGTFGVTNPTAPPTEWLAGTPFRDYTVPSVILIAVVGGSWLAAGVLVLGRVRRAREAAQLAGLIMLGWIATQVSIMGYRSWLQPAMFGAGLLVLTLARRPGGDGAPRRAS